MSTPTSTKASSRVRSSGVGEAMPRRSEGMWSPGRPCTEPPWEIVATTESASIDSTTSVTLPSPTARQSPGRRSSTSAS
jgi:hypothetical protein